MIIITIGICIVTDDSKILLNSCNITGKENEKIAELIAGLSKKCMKCGEMKTRLYITQCQCMLCKTCLKAMLFEKNDQLLNNSFEASKGKEGVFNCPIHNLRIDPKILQAILTPEELEDYTVEVMRRQTQEAKRKKLLWPNVCANCKGIISESIKNYQRTCYRHKICKDCIE